jgi:hypothetical protein
LDRLDDFAIRLIQVTSLSVRWHAARRRFPAAFDNVFAGLTLAHWLGTGGVLFSRLLECGGGAPDHELCQS